MQRASGAAVRAVIALGLTLGLASPLLAQRADRATISGVVTDDQSAAVPGATVTIKNEDTGVETVLVTNSAGAYTSPPLVLGPYSVTVDLAGFKKTVSSGILLRGAGAVRHDIALQVGALTESVEVKSVAGISETRPDVSHTVDEKYYQDLPFVTGSDVRLAESVLLMQPGYLPMRPNGDPMFRGSQFNSRINGGQAMATENFFDGAAFGYASGHQQSHESTPPLESVQQVKVITTTYSAQYGHTSGGFIEYASKSGTNSYRGSVYQYMADDAFNQNTIFAKRGGIKKTPIRNDNFGFTLGGPVRLPGYNGRDKTHFFVNLDYTRIRSGTIAGFGNTTPIDAFKAGDFGALLTGNQIGTDAEGRPIFQGQIFDPQTTRMQGNIPVRDPFPNNVIPANHPLRSVVASRIVPLMVGPDREGLANNVAGVGVGDQTWELNARNIMFRVDQNFTPAFKTSTSFYWNRRPSVRNCEGVDGCNYEFDPEKESAQNTEYYGSGFFQRISTHHAHQQFDWIISNNLLSHSTIAWDRWFMGGNHLSAGANWPQRLWQGTASPTGGIVAQDAGPPTMRFNGGSVPYTPIGLEGWPNFGFEKNDRWQFSSDVTWAKGRHTIKGGFEFRHHNFPSRGWAGGATAGNFNFDRLGTAGYNAAGNSLIQTGDPFASFLLGQVQTSNQLIPVFHTFRETYTALFINDEFKLSDKLTLTAGLRFDYESARTEQEDQVLDLQPDDTEPRSGRNSRRDDLRRRWSGALGTAQVRGRPQRCLGSAPGLRLSNRRQAGRSRRLRDLLRERGVQSGRSANAGIRIGPVRAEQHQRHLPRTSAGRGLSRGQSPVSAVHRSHNQYRWERHRRQPCWSDAAAIPELVGDVPTAAHEQHDADHLVHRESRKPAEPPLADVWSRREHEPSRCVGARYTGAAGQHQLGSGPERWHHAALSRIHRQCGPGAADVPAVPAGPMARKPGWPEPIPRGGSGTGTSVLAWSAGAHRLHVLPPHEQWRRGWTGR